MKLNAFVHDRIRSSSNYNVFKPYKTYLNLLKINLHTFHAVCSYFIFLNLLAHKFLEPNRHFTLKIDPIFVTVPFIHDQWDSPVLVTNIRFGSLIFKNTELYGWMKKIPRKVWVIFVLHCSCWENTDYGNLIIHKRNNINNKLQR